MAGKKIGCILALDGEREFTAAVQAAQKSTKLFEAQLKGLAEKFEGNANSMDYLRQKQELLKQQQGAYQKQLEAAQAGQKKANENYREQSKRLEELDKQLKSARQAQEQMEASGQQGTKEYEEQAKAVSELEKAYDKQNIARTKEIGSIAEWDKKVYEAEKSLKKQNDEIEKNEQYLKEAEQATDHCATSIDKMGQEAKQTSQEMEVFGDAADGVTQITTTLGDKVASAFVDKGASAALDLLKKGAEAVKESMYDLSGASAKLAASTGFSEAAAKKYQAVMKQIKGDNFGKSYGDVADAMSEVIQIMGELDDSSMTEITESAITLRDTFDMDVNESIRAVDVMMKTMGVDATTAFDLITKGAQNGLNRSGELTDNLTEYAQIWGQAGFSAEEMFAILENGLDAGAYNLDKVNDYVKEFGNSLADGRIGDNIDYFSDGTKKLFEEWKNGKASTSDVFYSVINDLSEMENQQQALTIASEVWSSLGEDNAMQVITALDDVNDAYKNVRGTMDSLKEVRYSDLESAVSGLGSAIQENLVTPIADAALPKITGLFETATEVVNGIGEEITPQKSILDEFVEDIKASNDEVEKALESAQAVVDNATDDVENLEAYKTVLMDLNEQENLTEFQKYQLESAVHALGDSVPGLTEAFNEETGVLNATNEELEAMFKNAEGLAMKNALLKAEQQTYEALAQATLDKARADDAVRQAQEEYDATLEKSRKYVEENGTAFNNYEGAVISASDTLWDAQRAQEEANKTFKKAKGQADDESAALERIAEQYGLLPESAKEASDSINTVGDAAGETARVLDEYGNDLTGLSEEEAAAVTAASEKIAEAYSNMRDSIAGSIEGTVSLFDEFSGGAEVTADEILTNLESQKAGIEQWSENMKILGEEAGGNMSQELYDALAEMGPESANLVQTLVDTLGSDAEKFKEIADLYAENLKLQDDADAIAGYTSVGEGIKENIEKGLDGIDEAVAEKIQGKIADAADDIETTQFRQKSQEFVKPIAEGIQSDTSIRDALTEVVGNAISAVEGQADDYRQAGAALGEKISEGLQEAVSESDGTLILNPDGISEKSSDYETAGRTLGEAVVKGLQDTQKSINDALTPGTEGITGKSEEYSAAGTALGEAFAGGLENAEKSASGAGDTVAGGAAKAMLDKSRDFQTAGQQSAQSYINALNAARQQAAQAGGAIASSARSAVASWENSFYNVGYNMASGVASGIYGGASGAVNAAVNMASRTLAAAKAALEIKSPSRKFQRDVGERISEGTAFGITRKASLAGKAAKKMSAKVYTNATSWLSKYKKSHQVSLEDEKWYWQQVQKHVKKGTDAYTKAAQKIKQISIQQTGVSSSLAGQIAKNFGVSKTTTTGSGKKKKTTKKDDATYYSEIYSAAEKYLSNYETLHNVSLKQEKAYWVGVQKQLKKGTQGYYDAQKQINSINDQIAQAAKDRLTTQASVQDSILDKYKVYYKVSAKAEMDYWNTARKQFKTGTDERIEADRKYFEAMQEWYDQRKELDEDYLENSKDINDQLADSVKELQDAYKDAVAERKQDILSSMDLFEAWDADGYTMDTLLHNLQTQVAGLALWEQQLEKLKKRGISTDLYDYLLEQGPDAAANIYSLANATDAQLTEYEKLFKQKNALAQSQAVQDNESLRQETNKEIAQLRTEAQAELNALNADYRAALQELNAGMDSSLKNLLAKAGKVGEDAVSGLVGGIKSAADSVEVYKSTTKVVSKVSSGLSALKKEGGEIGSSTLDGILAGMLDDAKIQTSAQKVIQSIKRAMEEEAEIHSPSRLFRRETGPQIPAGVALGMEDGTPAAVRSAQEMMQETLDAAQEEMAKRQTELQTSIPDYSGVMRLNRMLEDYQPQASVVNVDNSGMMEMMQQMMSGMHDMVEEIKNMKIVLDTGETVGALQKPLSQENAAVAGRRRRPR
ncbi:MAG: phage tail tape measure protein [Marvinbryantia sp.]|uniref:phage tail tape measure protein n=1 Tax=Marvinbryantia sp. TaxID=2496532 RepID=UPI00399C2F4A